MRNQAEVFNEHYTHFQQSVVFLLNLNSIACHSVARFAACYNDADISNALFIYKVKFKSD